MLAGRTMSLTDNAPRWTTFLYKLVVAAFVVSIFGSVQKCNVEGSTVDCSRTIRVSGELEYTKSMAVCIQQKNGFLANRRMRPMFRVIEAMPNAPKEFVGTWQATRPNCIYRHELEENGRFTSVPIRCLQNEHYQGEWGVYDGKMIWLVNGHEMWPPDINTVRWIDKDSFTLVERNGKITRFSRTQ
jgi:hypothetical protein